MLAITYTKITKIRVAEWGTPKKIFKKTKKKTFWNNIYVFVSKIYSCRHICCQIQLLVGQLVTTLNYISSKIFWIHPINIEWGRKIHYYPILDSSPSCFSSLTRLWPMVNHCTYGQKLAKLVIQSKLINI